MRYFNVDSIAGQRKYHILKIIENDCYPNDEIKKATKNIVSKLYRENMSFFFNVGNSDINSSEGIIRYLGRYLAHFPIAEYKITDINDDKVTFFFNNLANDKEKNYITMSSEKFISHILIHLPPKNFK